MLIDAQNHISKKIKSKLLIVGDGPDIDKYKKMAKKQGDNVIFTGAVPWEEIPYYYASADIFATASVSETQGLTVIEAMAASLPVVCADDSAFKATVVDDLNGKIFKNKREYKKYMVDILTNEDEKKKLSKQARITADSHSLKYYAEKILDVYNCAIKQNAKKSILTKIKEYFKG